MKLPAARSTKMTLFFSGARWLRRVILALVVGMFSLGLSTTARAQASGAVTHNPKQTTQNGDPVKFAEISLTSVSAKLSDDGSKVELTVDVSESPDDSGAFDAGPAKLEIEDKDGNKLDPPLEITQSGKTSDLSFNHEDLPGCKYKVKLVADLWGEDKAGEQKDVTLDDSQGGSGGPSNQSVMFRYGLGFVRNGGSGGVLKVESNKPSADLYSPKSININLNSRYVTRDVNGFFQKAVTDDTITTITNVVENQGYTIEFASRKNNSATGTLFKKVTVSDPGMTVVANTPDQKLYQEERWGASNFGYELPLRDDNYKVRLYFAELYHDHVGGGVFDVVSQGNAVLSNYDIFQAAGGKNAAKVEEVPAVVSNGKLTLGFKPGVFGAHVSAIAVVRDGTSPIAGTEDDGLYQTERTGNFSWQAPVPNGNYQVTLLFAETVYQASARRVFNVSAQGVPKLTNYDIYAAVGSNTAKAETFPVSVANGTLELQFASVTGEAKVSGILVKDAATGNVVAAVHAGGNAFTAADGTVFGADSGFTGGEKSYPGRVVTAIDCGSNRDYTAQDGTVFKADAAFTGGRVYSGAFSRLRLAEQEGSAAPRVSEFSWIADPRTGEFSECDLSYAGGLKVEGKQEIWSQDRQSYDRIRTIRDAAGNLVSKTVTTFENKGFGFAKVREVEDPNGAAITTTWTYEEGNGIPGDPYPAGYGREKQMMRSNGYWEQYAYDSKGRRVKTVSCYMDSGLGDEAASKVETRAYGTSNPFETRVVTVQGKEISRDYVAKFESESESERWEITCQVPGAAWNAAGNLIAKTCRYPSNFANELFRGRMKWSREPNGVLTTYSYTQSGADLVKTVDQGAGSGGAVTAGTRTVTTTNVSGETIGEILSDIATGLTVSSWTALEVDDLGRVTKKGYGDGTVESKVYVGSVPGCTACSGSHDLVDSETNREGITTSYKYDGLGRRTETTRLGITEKLIYDGNGHVTKRERIGTDGSAMTLEETHFDNAGRMQWTKDALGSQMDIAYSPDGLITTTTYSYGTRVETVYKDGRVKQISGTAVAPVKYAYGWWSDANGGGAWTKKTKVGGNGSETEWVKTCSDLAGHSVKMEYADGATAVQSYNGFGQLVKSVDPDGMTTLFAYNAQGEQETTVLDMNGNGVIDNGNTDRITRTVHDVSNHSGLVVNRSTTSQWTQNGVDSAAVIAVNEQDGYGNKSWQKDAGGNETAMQRTLLGAGSWTETVTRPDGSRTVQTYQNGYLASTTLRASTGAQLQATSFHYDAHGRMDAQTDARNGTTNFTYDHADQMRTKTEPSADGTAARQFTQYEYNAAGQLKKTILPDTTETHNEYWPNGALKKTYGSQTYTVEYTYDPQGRMRTMTTTGQAGPAVTTWNYDSQRGWLKTKVYADGKGPEYTYTAAGRLKTRKWARGVVTTYNYTTGDLTGIDYSDTTPDVTYGYNRRGLRETVTDASGTRSIAYNANGEIATEAYTAGLMNGLSIERSFDSLLRHDGLTLKSGSTTLHGETLGYGEASRLDHILSGAERVDYGYEPNSALVHTVTFKHNNSPVMTTTKDYDFVNRLTEIKSVAGSTTVSRYAYEYNSLNQRKTATLADNGYWSYGYNAKGEVISGTRKDTNGNAISGENFGYEFDGIGNRLTTSIDGATASSYTANALNQYTTINSNSPIYDEDGNLTSDGSKLFVYNGENRLVQVKNLNNTLIATYTYDDNGRRIRKVTTAQATQGIKDLVFIWDGWNTAMELNYQQSVNSYELAQTYVWGLDIQGNFIETGGVGGLVMELNSSEAFFPTYDGSGNIVDLVQASNRTVVASYQYDAFGNRINIEGSYVTNNSWGYSTKFLDIESHLINYQLRFYNPMLGRWISRDPIEEKGGMNLYGYVENDSINKIDRYGLDVEIVSITVKTNMASGDTYEAKDPRQVIKDFFVDSAKETGKEMASQNKVLKAFLDAAETLEKFKGYIGLIGKGIASTGLVIENIDIDVTFRCCPGANKEDVTGSRDQIFIGLTDLEHLKDLPQDYVDAAVDAASQIKEKCGL